MNKTRNKKNNKKRKQKKKQKKKTKKKKKERKKKNKTRKKGYLAPGDNIDHILLHNRPTSILTRWIGAREGG